MLNAYRTAMSTAVKQKSITYKHSTLSPPEKGSTNSKSIRISVISLPVAALAQAASIFVGDKLMPH